MVLMDYGKQKGRRKHRYMYILQATCLKNDGCCCSILKSCINMFYSCKSDLAQSAGAVEYTDCISAEGLKKTHPTSVLDDTKQSDGEVPVMLELWGTWSTPSLSSLPHPLWSKVVAPDRILCMGQIELNCVLMLN